MGRPKGKGVREKRRRKTPDIISERKRPANWDKALSAAYLRLLGATQIDAAMHVGVSDRSIRAWEGSKWWPMAVAEARERWLKGGDSECMKKLVADMAGGKDGAITARWWAERRIPEFAPPKQRVGFVGDDGQPLATEISIKFVDPGKK